jgi:hypothetical protein
MNNLSIKNIKDGKIESVGADEIKMIMEDLLTADYKTQKQISAIKDEKIKLNLIKFFRDMVSNEPEQAAFKQMAIMDVYAIARILRDFDPTISKPGSAFKGTAENVIYYAGYSHIETIVEFFTKYLRLKPQVVFGDTEGGCKTFVKMDISKTSFL